MADAVGEWKLKHLVQRLAAASGNGTSMVSLVIPPRDQVARVQRLLTEEHGAAANIKSRVNRLSVLSAITSTQQRLKLYPRIPPNGLAVYCGTVTSDDGKEKMVTIDFEPFKPVASFLYECGNRFNTAPLAALLAATDTYGFIVVDGHGCLFATVAGNHKRTLQRLDVDLPRKHRRGGQSSARFGRIRAEKRQAYVTKLAELAGHHFLDGERAAVHGLVLAGSADFKADLANSALFDPRLQARVVAVVDVAYGGESGLNQAIELAAPALSGVRLVQEQRVVRQLFDCMAKDTGKYCFGAADTMAALAMGAVDQLIVWEDLPLQRLEYADAAGAREVRYADAAAPVEGMELVAATPLVEHLADHAAEHGAALHLVSDRSCEGAQFCRAFGGLGALLRFVVDLPDPGGGSEDDFDGFV